MATARVPSGASSTRSGVGGMALHDWALATRTFRRTSGQDGRETGIDEDFATRSFANLGRNMFGPIRAPWLDEGWRGWWGENTPYHGPCSCSPIMLVSLWFFNMGRVVNSTYITLDGTVDNPHLWPSLGGSGSELSFELQNGLLQECDGSSWDARLARRLRQFGRPDRGDSYSDPGAREYGWRSFYMMRMGAQP
jgi:hypothetical protein